MYTIDELLEKEFNGIRYKHAVYKKREGKLELTLEYFSDVFETSDENIERLEIAIKNLLGYNIEIDFNFNKFLLDDEALLTKLYLYMKNDFPALSKYLSVEDIRLVDIVGMDVRIEIRLPKNMHDYAKETHKDIEIAEKIKKDFFCNPIIIFTKKEIDVVSSISKNKEFLQSTKIPQIVITYDISNKVNIIGKNVYNTALDFSAIKEPLKNVCICGRVKYVEQKSFKKIKKIDNENIEIDATYFSIMLAEKGKTIYATVFANDKDIESLSKIELGMNVAMKGNFNIFKEKLTFVANEICMCEYKISNSDEIFKEPNQSYHIVTPVEYFDAEQIDLFTNKLENLNESLQGKFCIFDVETTGLEVETDEIIEIGACVIENGHIVSTFNTLVKPVRPISQEITNLTGITNQMIETAPDIISVFPDFYKYCHDCILVAHNIDFDYKFINKIAKKLYYKLDNQQVDTLLLAKNKLRGLKNYRLSTVAEGLNIINPNAHRALSDAITTAKILIKLY